MAHLIKEPDDITLPILVSHSGVRGHIRRRGGTRHEPGGVQALRQNLAIEGIGEGVVGRPAGPAEVQGDDSLNFDLFMVAPRSLAQASKRKILAQTGPVGWKQVNG